MDGTLTNAKKEITPRTRQAIRRAIEAGVQIVLASGRPVLGIQPLADALELPRLGGYILAYNGGHIIDCKTGQSVYARMIPASFYTEICDFARSLGVSALTYDDTGVVTEQPNAKYVHKEAYNNKIPIKGVDNLGAHVTWPVPKFMVVGEPEALAPAFAAMERHFTGRLSVFLSEPYFMEITPLGVKKDSALQELLAHLGLQRENLMAIGDGLNDIPMLRCAGLAIAMENAYPETKAVADAITASNEEDGVAVAVERYLVGEWA